MMLTELTMWSQKLKDGLQLAHSFYQDHGASLPKHITKIAFVGMGGSGVAGRIMKTFLDRKPGIDRKSTRLNSSHIQKSRMPSSA